MAGSTGGKLVAIGARSAGAAGEPGTGTATADTTTACSTVSASTAAAIPGNLALEAEGWQRRYLADEHRAREALELYSSLGFDVRAEKLDASHFGPQCGECSLTVCTSYVLIYTRRAGTAASDGGGSR